MAKVDVNLETESGYSTPEEGLIEVSQKLRVTAGDLLKYMENFLLNPPEKEPKVCRGIIASPLSELKANLQDTLLCLGRIRELFNIEIVKKLK